MLAWPVVEEFPCLRELRVTPACAGMTEYNSSLPRRREPVRLSIRRWMLASAGMTVRMDARVSRFRENDGGHDEMGAPAATGAPIN